MMDSDSKKSSRGEKMLQIDDNRRVRSYKLREYFGRLLWAFAKVPFHCSPRMLYGWRNFCLRCFGANIGHNVRISASVSILLPWNLTVGNYAAIGDHAVLYNLGPLVIGARSTVSQRAHICGGSHDVQDPLMQLIRAPITIGEDAWICADAFVGPKVKIGDGAVVGARAVVVRDVDEWTIVAGNPAKLIRTRELVSSKA